MVTPIEYLVDAPVQLLSDLSNYFVSKNSLRQQNELLQSRQLLMEAEIHNLLTVRQENTQLRALLSSAAKVQGRVHVAQILALNLDQFDPQVVIDKGSKSGVYQGQPILDASGVMGQVIEVGLLTSRALLLTSTRSAVPIEDIRSGVRAIAIGQGAAGTLRLVHVPDTTDIKSGDLLITSGLGLRYPVGYPVGTVTSVNQIVGRRFLEIEVEPSAQLNRSRDVLLVWTREPILLAKAAPMLVDS